MPYRPSGKSRPITGLMPPHAAAWHPRLGKAKLGGLLEPGFAMADRANLAGQRDLAKDDGVSGNRRLAQRRDQRRRHRQIRRRLGYTQATSNVEINVVGADREPAARIEHRDDHREPRAVPANNCPPWGPEQSRRDQRLNLDQHRSRPFDAGENRRAAELPGLRWIGCMIAFGRRWLRARALTPAEEQCRGVWHLDQPAVAHLEHPDLVGGAKAVLDGAQNAKAMAAFAFEIEHG